MSHDCHYDMCQVQAAVTVTITLSHDSWLPVNKVLWQDDCVPWLSLQNNAMTWIQKSQGYGIVFNSKNVRESKKSTPFTVD